MRSVIALAGAIALVGAGLAASATSVSAAPPAPAGSSSVVVDADKALKDHPAAIRRSAGDAYAVYSSKKDLAGRGVVRYTRTYHGLRVYGGDFVIRTDAKGAFAGSSVGLAAPLNLNTKAKVGAARAKQVARSVFRGKATATSTPELFVDASNGSSRLAWETVVTGWQPDGQTPSRLHVISDAHTGAVVGSFDEIQNIAGTGNSVYSGQVAVDTTLSGSTYSMIDPSHGNGRTCDMNNGTSTCTTLTDADNAWGTGATSNRQSAAVDAHFGAAMTFDYFKNVHGRNGIFGNGTGVPSRVHYGNNYVNAFWDSAQMTYGDGAGNAKPLVSLDVAGHEMAHGVTENLVAGGPEPASLSEPPLGSNWPACKPPSMTSLSDFPTPLTISHRAPADDNATLPCGPTAITPQPRERDRPLCPNPASLHHARHDRSTPIQFCTPAVGDRAQSARGRHQTVG